MHSQYLLPMHAIATYPSILDLEATTTRKHNTPPDHSSTHPVNLLHRACCDDTLNRTSLVNISKRTTVLMNGVDPLRHRRRNGATSRREARAEEPRLGPHGAHGRIRRLDLRARGDDVVRRADQVRQHVEQERDDYCARCVRSVSVCAREYGYVSLPLPS